MISEQDGTSRLPETDTRNTLPLPLGITLQQLRTFYALPASARLIVQFVRSSREKISLTMQDESGTPVEYSWEIGRDYLVVPNSGYSPFVYLSPLFEHGDTSADMPFAVDSALSQAEIREQLGELEVLVRSPDTDIAAVIEKMKQAEYSNKQMERYVQDLAEFGSEQRAEYISGRLQNHLGADCEIGSEAVQLVEHVAGLLSEDIYILQVASENAVSAAEVFQAVAEEFIAFCSATTTEHAAAEKKHDVVFYIDSFVSKMLPDDSGFTVVTTFVKGRGWSIALPTGECPQQITSLLKSYMEGQASAATFPKFIQELEEWIAAEKIHFDVDQRSVGVNFDSLEKIPLRAVFHGDDTVLNGIETLRIMGDPYMGVSTFQKQIYRYEDLDFITDIDQAEPLVILKK